MRSNGSCSPRGPIAAGALAGLAAIVLASAAPAAAAKPKCFGVPATIIGTPDGNDVIDGSEGDDVIVTWGGKDRIRGHGGNDLICAGSGNDRVRGGSGSDRILGGSGNDVLIGDYRNSEITGRGRDLIRGGSGNDVVTEDRAPIFEAAVRGQDHSAFFVTGVDQLEEQVCAAGRDRQIADLGDDQ